MLKREKRNIYNMHKLCQMAKRNPKKMALSTEVKYKESIIDVAKKVANNISNNRIVLISGPSASGKTTTSHLLVNKLKMCGVKSVVVSMDDFFISRKETPTKPDGSKDYDNIKALDLELFKKCVDNLLADNYSKMPKYDFVNGVRNDDAYSISIDDDKTVIVIEGIHAFNPLIITDKMAGKCTKIYICTNSDFRANNTLLDRNMIRFCRRVVRDFYFRGSSVENTETLWKNVREAEELFIVPYKDTADFIIDTIHSYEPFLYKSQIQNIAQTDENAIKYLKLFDFCAQDVYKYISKDSLVWEFLRDPNQD